MFKKLRFLLKSVIFATDSGKMYAKRVLVVPFVCVLNPQSRNREDAEKHN